MCNIKKKVNDKNYNCNDLEGTIKDIDDEESLKDTTHFILDHPIS